MKFQEKLEAEVYAYNSLIETLQKLEEQRLARSGRIELLRELVAAEEAQAAEEAEQTADVADVDSNSD